MKFTDALDGYWLERRRNLSDNTVEQYEWIFGYALRFIGDVEVEQISSDNIRHWLNWLKDEHNLAPKSCSNSWTALSSFFSWAENELNIPHPIREKVACPTVPPPAIDYYSQTDLLAMIQACEMGDTWKSRCGKPTRSVRRTAARDKAIITTLLDTGLRASELTDLKMMDYDKDSGKVIVRKGKGSKFRVVYLGMSARRAIWRYLSNREDRNPTDPLFSTQRGKHIDINSLRATIKRIAARAGVPKANLHRFRHTFAINFLRNGGSPLELKELLGHSKMDTVLIYVRLAEVDLQRAQRIASPADNWQL
ncbi:MAG: tyrosine-type recombinase/integrase [Chloroflexota bacterium]